MAGGEGVGRCVCKGFDMTWSGLVRWRGLGADRMRLTRRSMGPETDDGSIGFIVFETNFIIKAELIISASVHAGRVVDAMSLCSYLLLRSSHCFMKSKRLNCMLNSPTVCAASKMEGQARSSCVVLARSRAWLSTNCFVLCQNTYVPPHNRSLQSLCLIKKTGFQIFQKNKVTT